MADDRLPCWRSVSMDETRSDRVTLRSSAISLRLVQNASSRLTLVLCPAMTMERLTTGDFIGSLPFGPVLVEIAAGFGGARLIEVALGFRTAVSETIFRGVFFTTPSLGSFAGSPKID